MIKLTFQGEEAVKEYIKELETQRKEILDANKDTADDTEIPSIDDIISDIELSDFFADEKEDYYNNWGVTDNYNSDYPLHLAVNEDFIVLPN